MGLKACHGPKYVITTTGTAWPTPHSDGPKDRDADRRVGLARTACVHQADGRNVPVATGAEPGAEGGAGRGADTRRAGSLN